jgi:hypothetical protein
MNMFKPAVVSPKQIERRKRIWAKGRKHYIFYTGILGWGMSMFLVETLWRWHDRYGWHAAPRGDLHFAIVLLAGGLVICSIGGYFFGALRWRKLELEKPTWEE